MSRISALSIVLCSTLVGGLQIASPGVGLAGQPTVELHQLTTGLDYPVVITHAGDSSGRLFVGEQTGAIRIIRRDGVLRPQPFLDLDSQSACCGERGLLGIAFHPDYASNGYFYVHYSDNAGDTVISRFSVSAGDPDVADIGSELELLTVDQPFSNHNGGQIEFGPDGYLYIALGDGGSANDPGDRAQDMLLLLGKLLRIDVDNPEPPLDYGIPADNPFADDPDALPEIWASGLRNPWRFSFDRATGDLFIGDVGQNVWEEIDLQPASSLGGENWGWRCYEGDAIFNFSTCSASTVFEFPILTYQHASGNCSVNGGYRYRGPSFPNFYGTYFYGDYCTGRIWGATYNGVWGSSELADMPTSQSTFGENEDGELFVAAYGSNPAGTIYRIVDTSFQWEVFSDDFETGGTTNWDLVTP